MDGSRAARVLLAAALVLGVHAAAAAADVPDVALALGGDPLFVDADAAGALSPVETEQLRARLRTATTPVFLALLAEPPPSPDTGSPDPATAASGLPAAIAAAADRPGTYAVVAGTDFRAVSTVIGERAGELAGDTLEAVGEGATTATALLEFVDAVEVAASQAAPGAPSDGDDAGDGSGPLQMPDPWVVAFAAVGGLLVFGARRRRR